MIPRKILFSTDFSKNSEPARELALAYAKAFKAALVIAHVIDSRAGVSAYAETVPADVSQILRGMERSAATDLEMLAKEFLGDVAEVKTCCRIGIPARDIVRMAEEEQVDLIVMGTHGWTGLRHLILGSTAENVVRTAKCPVLTVRAPSGQ